MRNRALEFLIQAHGLLEYPFNEAQARIYVRIAMDEVRELLDRLALYEMTDGELQRRIETRPAGGVLVEDTRVVLPARLVEQQRPRAALTGNGRR